MQNDVIMQKIERCFPTRILNIQTSRCVQKDGGTKAPMEFIFIYYLLNIQTQSTGTYAHIQPFPVIHLQPLFTNYKYGTQPNRPLPCTYTDKSFIHIIELCVHDIAPLHKTHTLSSIMYTLV